MTAKERPEVIKIELEEVSKDQNTRTEVLSCNSEANRAHYEVCCGKTKGLVVRDPPPPAPPPPQPFKPSLVGIRMTPMATPLEQQV